MALPEILWPVSLVAAAMLWLDLRAARDERAVGSLFRTALRAMAWVALAAATGAMVGAHPFGGFNMSGTNSKAGGPDYLLQFVQGKSIARKL